MALSARSLLGAAFALLPGLLLGACSGGAAASRAARIEIAAQLDREFPAFGTITVHGLDARLLRRAESRDQRGLAVLAAPEVEPAPETPRMLGRWRVVGGRLEFTPAFPPSGGMWLLVRVDTGALSGRSGGAPVVEARFQVPVERVVGPGPELLAVHPSADTLPENQLRWYLQFSRPMRPGDALEHVHLLDERGAEVHDAFLMVGDELWDPSGTRLTLLLDPGRVKQGIRTNVELGRPLQAGRQYRLRINADWRDAAGRPLGRVTEKRFAVVAPDFVAPNPAEWLVTEPSAGTQAALALRFTEPLDHALARRLLAVYDQSGEPVPGEVTLADKDRLWRFTPAALWNPGEHEVRVSPELEDLAGNRPGRVFDRDVTAERRGFELVRRFRVMPARLTDQPQP